MIVYKEQKRFLEAETKLEKQLEDDVVNNAKLFFGLDSIYIDAKKKLDSKSLGGCIPDGFLFDLSDKENPQFYIVEVELAKHDFYGHIFPQFTKFFGFFKISNNKGDLVDKLFGIINNDDLLKKDFKKYLQEKEIYKFIKDLIEESQNILLIIDGEKSELPDVLNTYNDTWGKFVKIIVLKKFISGNEAIFTMDPEFENINYSYVNKVIDEKQDISIDYDEKYHLENVTEDIKNAYNIIKSKITGLNINVKFNCRKYYIAIALEKNLSYFQFSKKKIRLVVMKDEEYVKSKVEKHHVKHLTESVQKFWNGNCCEIELMNSDSIDEVINIIEELLTTAST
jgi:predicted transport protein